MSLSFKERYLNRLGLDEADVASTTFESLAKITEAHLEKIMFGNLSLHMDDDATSSSQLPTLDMDATSTKVLDNHREGFCYELNLMLASLLEELGYSVERIDAQVAKGDMYTPNVHLFLLVNKTWFVDVGFGEPAIHPLQYEMDTEQETAEGMKSRFVTKDTEVVLEWKIGDAWLPRLKWAQALEGKKVEEFQPNLDLVLTDKLPFMHKYFCVKITKDEKLSIAGNKLKRTTPRFGEASKVTITEFESIDEVRKSMEKEFGIPLEGSKGLDWTKSLEAPPQMWMHF